MGERVTVGVVGPALHGALVAGATAEHGRLDHQLPRAARHVALAAREIFLGLAVELLLAAHRAEVIGLTLVARLRRRLGGLDGHLADGIKDRKSTRLNSSHVSISYAVFCLKKKKIALLISGHFAFCA